MSIEVLREEIERQRPDLRIDYVGQLVRGAGVEAVCTDTKTGRQGVWPRAWVDMEPSPATIKAPSVQRSLFS